MRACGEESVLPTEGDVSNVVAHSGVRVLELQRRLPVAKEHLGGRVAGSPSLLELLRAFAKERTFKHWIFFSGEGVWLL